MMVLMMLLILSLHGSHGLPSVVLPVCTPLAFPKPMAAKSWSSVTPDGYLEDAPLVRVIKSTVVKEKDQDLVLHTVEVRYFSPTSPGRPPPSKALILSTHLFEQLEHEGWKWYTTIHWAQIKDLNSSLSVGIWV